MQVCKHQLGSCAKVFSYAGCLTTSFQLVSSHTIETSPGCPSNAVPWHSWVTVWPAEGSKFRAHNQGDLISLSVLVLNCHRRAGLCWWYRNLPDLLTSHTKSKVGVKFNLHFYVIKVTKAVKKCFLTKIKSKINIWNLICRLAKMQACKEVEVPHLSTKHHHFSVLHICFPRNCFLPDIGLMLGDSRTFPL